MHDGVRTDRRINKFRLIIPMDTVHQKTFKILSIDGGGIKGLYSASILEQFEKKFECLTSDHFDMICGTSTGGADCPSLIAKNSSKRYRSVLYQKWSAYISGAQSVDVIYKTDPILWKVQ
ncbi:hypothetical protein C4F49_16735 [Sphingobacterium sp. KB22]|uniref:PNPLA domain-containing protein n=1 Tax=Sphingobacterium hungaricum TaxID=2082723 RepID=A0A928UY03_9SPHI|nr:hypothetical protein [Sphingobacterium hungaricum]